jgi:hypothetical protein
MQNLDHLATNEEYSNGPIDRRLCQNGGAQIEAVYEHVDTNPGSSLRLHFPMLRKWDEIVAVIQNSTATINRDIGRVLGYNGRREIIRYLDGLLSEALEGPERVKAEGSQTFILTRSQLDLRDLADPATEADITGCFRLNAYDALRSNLVLDLERLSHSDYGVGKIPESVQSARFRVVSAAHEWGQVLDN